MRTPKLIGLAMLGLSVMAIDAMAACAGNAPRNAPAQPRHSPSRTRSCGGRGHGNGPAFGISFPIGAPAGNPGPYIPPPPQPSTLGIGGTVYNIDGGGGAVIAGDPPDNPEPQQPQTSILDELDLEGRRRPLNRHTPQGDPDIQEDQSGSMTRTWRDGTREITRPDGSQSVIFPDGSSFQRNADGSMVDTDTSGRRTTRDSNGDVTGVEQVRPPNEIGPEGAPRLDVDRYLNGGTSQPGGTSPQPAGQTR